MKNDNIVRGRGTKDMLLIVATILLMLSLVVITLQPKITGLVVFEQSSAVDIGSIYYTNSSVPLGIQDKVTSLDISGNFTGDGYARVWLESDGKRYLVLDTSNISVQEQSSNSITGLIIGDNSNTNNAVDNSNISSIDSTSSDQINDTVVSGDNMTPSENLTPTENVDYNVSANATQSNNETITENLSNANESGFENITNSTTSSSQATENMSLQNETENVTANITTDVTSNVTINSTSNETSDIIPNVSLQINETNTTNESETVTHQASKTFDSYCDVTCALSNLSSPYTLIIEVTGNSTLYIDHVSYKYTPKETIVQITDIPNITLSDNLTMDLSKYFTGDGIIYDSVHLTYVNYSISENLITYSALRNGTENAVVYATTAGQIVTSNTFTITVMPQNVSNTTTNITEITIEDNATRLNLLKKIKNLKIAKLLKHTKSDNTSDYDVEFDDNNDSNSFVKIYGIKNISMLSRVNIISLKNHKQPKIVTDIVDVNTLNITNATIRIRKYSDMSAVARCDNYDSVANTCDSWVTTDIPFIDYGDYIEFTVDHFTGYGGIAANNLLYVSGGGLTNNAIAVMNLSTAQDGTYGYINRTSTTISGTGILLGMLNASIINLTARTISTSNSVNFSAYWQTGSTAAGNVTYKLYANNSGTLNIICKSGNDSANGTIVVVSTAGLITGGCRPTSNITLVNGDGLLLSINFWVTTAGVAANRWARIWWDNTSFNTFVNYTYSIPATINVTANQSIYLRGQRVNVSGIFSWINNSVISSRNVTVQFINTTNNVVYTMNATTDASGNYSANYTIPAGADVGVWDVNVTGIFNNTINATGNSSFTVDSPPTIKSVVALSAINPIESTPQVLKFNFTVDDADGNWTINISSAKVIINYSSIVRQSSACSGIVVNGTAQNISCNVTINYYDLSGTWSVNVSIKDNSTSYVENSTTTFTYNTLTAISLNSNSFNFGTLSIGQQNATTLTPINISNTGNSNFSKASIEGYDLVNGSSMIGAGNMSINATNISNGHIIINNTFVNITNSALGRNNDTLNTSLSLYLYIDVPNMTLPAASYKSINSWVLNMLP